ncbi:MAG TPA: phosphopyruvate hydratase [Proteobacteria bacterium]|nr:phosphopyruvate hydratase [Pseudomonadota bacterium]
MAEKYTVRKLSACEVFDSRGMPTVACRVDLEHGAYGFMQVPSGASTGQYEAYELRDGDKNRHRGKGVQRVVDSIEGIIQSTLIGHDLVSIADCDERLCSLDPTPQKRELGANALLAVSGAFARAVAMQSGVPLHHHLDPSACQIPVPMMNVLNGGRHASNNLTIQEFMIVPHGFDSLHDAIAASSDVMHALGEKLKRLGGHHTRGDEGGFAPQLDDARQALDLIAEAIESSPVSASQVGIALDMAASEYANKAGYFLDKAGSYVLDPSQWTDYVHMLCDAYPIVSVEDPAGDDDQTTWSLLSDRLADRIQLVGDDLFVTNTVRLKEGVERSAGNAILIKPNQIGTLSETLETIALAKKNDYSCIMSHRSGETEDTFIADLAVATGCTQIKTGSLSRSERLAKYNQLLRIEEEIGKHAKYIGNDILTGAC